MTKKIYRNANNTHTFLPASITTSKSNNPNRSLCSLEKISTVSTVVKLNSS